MVTTSTKARPVTLCFQNSCKVVLLVGLQCHSWRLHLLTVRAILNKSNL